MAACGGWPKTPEEELACDDAIDPIRAEALSGRPMIVFTEGRLTGRLNEALAVAGRTRDLRVVRLSEGALPGCPVDGRARRPGPWRDDVGTCRERRRNGSDVLPPLREAEAFSARSVVVVDGRAGRDALFGYGFRLLEAAAARAEREGRPGPLLILHADHAFDLAPAYHAMDIVETAGFQSALALIGSEPAILRNEADRADPTIARGWRRRLDAFDAANPVRVDGDAAVVCDGKRLVVATRVRDFHGWVGRGTTSTINRVHEVGRGGATQSTLVEWVEGEPMPAARLARLAWRGGVARGSRRQDQPYVDMAPLLSAHAGAAMADAGPLIDGTPAAGWGLDGDFLGFLKGYREAECLLHVIAGDPGPQGRRLDFARTWPACAGMLLDPGKLAQIDAGEPTLPLVAGWLDVPKGVARRIVGLRHWPFQGEGVPEPGALLRGARVLARLGHANLPAAGDTGEWECLTSLLALAGRLGTSEEVVPDMLLAIPGASWRERHAAVDGKAIGAGHVEDARAMAHGFAGWLSLAGNAGIGLPESLSLLVGGGSLLTLLRRSEEWHAQPILREGARGLPLDCTWPVPFGPVCLGNGWSARVLGGVRELYGEGGEGRDRDGIPGLAHCVGGYGRKCQTGRSLVLSLRRSDGNGTVRVSTAELAPVTDMDVGGDDGTWVVGDRAYALVQHKGYANADPGDEAGSRLGALRAALAAGSVPIRREALDARPAVDEAADPAHIARMHVAWRRILPRRHARLDLADLVETALAERARLDRKAQAEEGHVRSDAGRRAA